MSTDVPLERAQPIAFVAVTDLGTARAFYEGVHLLSVTQPAA